MEPLQDVVRVKSIMTAGVISAAVLGILSAMAIAVIVVIIGQWVIIEIKTAWRRWH